MFSVNRVLISLAFIIGLLSLVQQTSAADNKKPPKQNFSLTCDAPVKLRAGKPECTCYNRATRKEAPLTCRSNGRLHCKGSEGFAVLCQPADPCGSTKVNGRNKRRETKCKLNDPPKKEKKN
ncbi:hypothetical protein DFH28DRAFT_1034051 [Melampsora americana]|nr:hypothetical protein DFH28DRAFT_1034051 [Melampsora americana]